MPPLPALPQATARAATLRPWHRYALLATAGAATALALPPLHVIPVLWLAFPTLLWLMDADARPRGAFVAGWVFGIGHFAAGLYWVSHALLIDPWRHGWLIPLALGGFGAGLGIFTGLAALAARLAGPGLARVVAFAAAWTLAEWVRSWLFTGFPWNLMGTVWMPLDAMLQSAAWIGTYGLGFLTVAAASLPVALVTMPQRRALSAMLAGLLVLGLVWAAGTARLAQQATGQQVPGVKLRLVQAGIPQALKWREDMRQAHVVDQIALSRSPGFADITHVIWPETAAPYFLDLDGPRRALVAEAAPPGGVLITGAPRRSAPGQPLQVWNSLFAIDSAGRVLATYDKVHLVPFGEYIPLRFIIPAAIEKLTVGGVDFSAGAGRVTASVPGAPPFSPLICYEIIFPGAAVGDGERPGWIVNLTNDGWFGISSGPYQHFASARMRAIEEGLPVVRAANTGISAVIDAYGRVVGAIPLGDQGVLDSGLPVSLNSTPIARSGMLIPLGIATIAYILSVVASRHSRTLKIK